MHLTLWVPFHMYREQINVITLTLSNTVHSALLVYSDIYLWFRVTSDQAPHFSASLELKMTNKTAQTDLILDPFTAPWSVFTTWCLRCAYVWNLGTMLNSNILDGNSQRFTVFFKGHVIQAKFRLHRNEYFMRGHDVILF